MVDPKLLYAMLAVLPPGAVFFFAFGRYDGTFRDNVVFLYFLLGLLLGFVLSFATILVFSTALSIIAIILLALLYPAALVVGINRRKWQGQRHSVFNGAALGLGVALMLSFTFLFVLFRDITTAHVAQAIVLGLALSALLFGLGLVVGDGVRRQRPFGAAFLSAAIMIAPAVFLEEFVSNRRTEECARERVLDFCLGRWQEPAGSEEEKLAAYNSTFRGTAEDVANGTNDGPAGGFANSAELEADRAGRAWLWVGLLLAYGAIVAIATERRLMIEGVEEESRKQRRRLRRAMRE